MDACTHFGKLKSISRKILVEDHKKKYEESSNFVLTNNFRAKKNNFNGYLKIFQNFQKIFGGILKKSKTRFFKNFSENF